MAGIITILKVIVTGVITRMENIIYSTGPCSTILILKPRVISFSPPGFVLLLVSWFEFLQYFFLHRSSYLVILQCSFSHQRSFVPYLLYQLPLLLSWCIFLLSIQIISPDT